MNRARVVTPKRNRRSWPEYLEGPDSSIHAIGAISLTFNELEGEFGNLFDICIGGHANAILFSKLSTELRIDLVRRSLPENASYSDGIVRCVEHFLNAYAILFESRNIIMHSTARTMSVYGDNARPFLGFNKPPKSDPLSRLVYRIPIRRLRRLADANYVFANFAEDISDYLAAHYDSATAQLFEDLGLPIPSLPRKPALPIRLSQPLPLSRNTPRRRRRSSPA